jgi:DNA-binding MurR/RpiR family transcriptional regulator
MIKYFLPRGTGKTTTLIQMAAETGATIVCFSNKECSRVANEALRAGYIIAMPISYDEFINKRYHSIGIKGFLIDNAEQVLQAMTDVRILAISATADKEAISHN